MQLELFEGEHIPMLRARAALEGGDLRGAHAALFEASVRATAHPGSALTLLESLLPATASASAPSPERVHAVFEEALAEEARSARWTVRAADWFRLYAVHMAAALDETPGRSFRGWHQLHYELAARRTGPQSRRPAHPWTLVACLTSDERLDPAAPALAHSGRSALDAPDTVLPELPDRIADLWTEAFVLRLGEPACAWVPALGVLNGTFAIADVVSDEVVRAARFDLRHGPPAEEPSPRAFLRALVDAREARARAPGACGALELQARAAMKRASPELFQRYMETLGLYG